MSRRLRLVSFVLGIAAFSAAAILVIAGHRGSFNWLLLGGTFGNLVIGRTVLKARSRVAKEREGAVGE